MPRPKKFLELLENTELQKELEPIENDEYYCPGQEIGEEEIDELIKKGN